MIKTGANRHDRYVINKMALEGRPIDEIARVTGCRPEVVEIFLPKERPEIKITTATTAPSEEKEEPKTKKTGSAKQGMPPGVDK